MRRAAKRDANENEILTALRKAGCDIILLDKFDLLVMRSGNIYMLECKTEKGKPTRSQELLKIAGWPLHFVRTPAEALKAVGL